MNINIDCYNLQTAYERLVDKNNLQAPTDCLLYWSIDQSVNLITIVQSNFELKTVEIYVKTCSNCSAMHQVFPYEFGKWVEIVVLLKYVIILKML
jgi:hypothetical protein